jgi:hypothetical protein
MDEVCNTLGGEEEFVENLGGKDRRKETAMKT